MTDATRNQEDYDVNLTLSERVARASGRAGAVPQDDGTILVELSLHRLEPSALPRPQTNKGFLSRLRRGLTGAAAQGDQIRYIKTRHGDGDPAP